MSSAAPIESIWDGEAFRPASPYMARRADKQFGRGELLFLVNEPERSSKSHNHFFAAIKNAWGSLPPLMSERFPSPTHLRKYALVKAGYCNSQSLPCGTAQAARRAAEFMRPMDEFAVITVTGSMLTVYTAKSTSYKAMPKAEFQKAKDACFAVIADLLDVSKAELSNSERAAA